MTSWTAYMLPPLAALALLGCGESKPSSAAPRTLRLAFDQAATAVLHDDRDGIQSGLARPGKWFDQLEGALKQGAQSSAERRSDHGTILLSADGSAVLERRASAKFIAIKASGRWEPAEPDRGAQLLVLRFDTIGDRMLDRQLGWMLHVRGRYAIATDVLDESTVSATDDGSPSIAYDPLVSPHSGAYAILMDLSGPNVFSSADSVEEWMHHR